MFPVYPVSVLFAPGQGIGVQQGSRKGIIWFLCRESRHLCPDIPLYSFVCFVGRA